ncbi:MAG: YicC family protein [Victivallaceae bacterium]|nr:YicC family protein [Victivallaceae bacterium]
MKISSGLTRIDKMPSMTGFGKASAVYDGRWMLSVEISSVNRKQLDIRVSLDSRLSGFEPDVRSHVGTLVSRGSVQVRASVCPVAGSAGAAVDEKLLASLVSAAARVRTRSGVGGEVSVETLMLVPGVYGGSQVDADDPGLKKAFLDLLVEAGERFSSMRRTEGDALIRDLLGTASELEKTLDAIVPLASEVPENAKQRLLERLERSGLPVPADDPSVLRETLIFVDRYDVSEETTRLRSHFVQLHGFLTSGAASGRNLDFLLQEMFREINTLGNKAGSAAVSPLLISFKSGLERMREQVQNLE